MKRFWSNWTFGNLQFQSGRGLTRMNSGYLDAKKSSFISVLTSSKVIMNIHHMLPLLLHLWQRSRTQQKADIIITIINPLTARVIGAPQMIWQPVFSIFPCSPLPSGTFRTPWLSIPWCCLPNSSSVCLVFFPLSVCLARWFWPDLMNRKHGHATAVCIS